MVVHPVACCSLDEYFVVRMVKIILIMVTGLYRAYHKEQGLMPHVDGIDASRNVHGPVVRQGAP